MRILPLAKNSRPEGTVRSLDRIRWLLRRQQATESLEARRQQLFQDPAKAVIVVDLLGRVLHTTPAARDLLGYGKETALVKQSAFGLFQPEQRQNFRALLASTLAAEITENTRFDLVKQSGESVSVKITAALLNNYHGSPPVLALVLRDSQRHRAWPGAPESNLKG